MLYSPTRDANLFIIWCHGNACDIGSIDQTCRAMSRGAKAHILTFEYPSYGLCTGLGEPNEETINSHASRAYSFVRDQLKWPTDRIVIYGHSIGSGAACHLASTQPVGGLILQSPYTSIKNLIQEKIGFLSNLINVSFWDNYEAMKQIRCPTLFIHGQRDDLIPSCHSKILFDSIIRRSNKELVLLPDDDHNSISDPILLMRITPFLNQYFPPTTSPMPPVDIDPALREPPATHRPNSNI